MCREGFGKLTGVDEFTAQNRGGKGIRCYRIVEKTGKVVGSMGVTPEDEIMMINTDGIIIRMQCSDISVLSRNASGVKLMNLKDGEQIACVAKVMESSRSGGDDEITDDDADFEADDAVSDFAGDSMNDDPGDLADDESEDTE